jgi:cell division protein FtsZ
MTQTKLPISMDTDTSFNQGARIKVFGVGGGGGNAVAHMIAQQVKGVEFICANTDAQALSRCGAEDVIQLGQSGLGAGGKPDKGKGAAENAEQQIRHALEGAQMAFITAGMGGGTGTGAAPVIARIAKEMGILTVGVVTKPFEFEGNKRMQHADAGLQALSEHVDSLIVVLNDKLLDLPGGEDMTQDEAFAHANDVLRNAVGGIAEIINVPGHVNADFEDVRTVMSEQGKAVMGTALSTGPDRARIAAEQAVSCPLLEGSDLSNAKGILVMISATQSSLKMKESKVVMNTIRAFASEDANIIYGTAYDDSLDDSIRVTVIATGLDGKTSPIRKTPALSVIETKPVVNAFATPEPSGMFRRTSGIDPAPVNPNVPSVWRTNRQHAHSKVMGMSNAGMDEAQIPAFLRKQAD